jgi:hypothetical protein
MAGRSSPTCRPAAGTGYDQSTRGAENFQNPKIGRTADPTG